MTTKQIILAVCVLLSTAPASAEPTIGAMAELSGPFARLGEHCRQGYDVARSENGDGVRVVIADHRNDPKTSISEYRRLRDVEKATTIIVTRSPIGLALNPLSARQKIPLIGVVGHPRFVSENPYAVRAFPIAEDESKVLADYAGRSGFLGVDCAAEPEIAVGSFCKSRPPANSDVCRKAA